MFQSLAHLIYRRRWYVAGLWIILLVVAIGLASQVGSVLGPGNFVEKGTDSARAADILDRQFRQNDLKVTIVVVHSAAAGIHDPAFSSAVRGMVTRIGADSPLRVGYLDNPLLTGNRQLIGKDGHSLAILLSSNLDEQAIEGQIDHLRDLVKTPGFTTYVTGTPATNHDYAVSTKDDLNRSDAITVPILIVLLLVIFGTVVAGVLPLLLAGISIALSLALVYIFGHYLDTSVYVTNVVTGLGLGIGIDYSLFIVYRFREELAATRGDVEVAIVRTMGTTGRAVFFSGLTVAIGMSALILTGVSFMQSMGLGGMLVPATALAAAMTLLPALLSILGPRINRFRVLPTRFLHPPRDGGIWHRIADTIMRHPILTGGPVLLVMLALIYPVTQLNFAFGGLQNAPRDLQSVQGIIAMQTNFPSTPDPVQIVIQHHGRGNLLSAGELAGLRTLEQRLAQDPEAAHVIGPADFVPAGGASTPAQRRQLAGRYLTADKQTAIITVIGRHDTGTKPNDDLVRRSRTLTASFTAGALRHDAIYVGGAQASYNDFNDALYSHFALIVAIVLLLTYGFLFYAFRSIVLPLKAVLLNLLSVGASFGILQLVFQRGIGAGLLGFTPETGVAGWVPIFLFAFLFGLSMDYEVFLLSRIREGWLATGDNRAAVIFGMGRTGRLITSAAAVMVIAFGGFVLGHQVQLKEFGFGLLAAIALDATLIRMVLVPAIMRLLGTVNWWVPRSLSRWAATGVSFGEGDEVVEQEPELVTA